MYGLYFSFNKYTSLNSFTDGSLPIVGYFLPSIFAIEPCNCLRNGLFVNLKYQYPSTLE
jgi:hypothetical protein